MPKLSIMAVFILALAACAGGASHNAALDSNAPLTSPADRPTAAAPAPTPSTSVAARQQPQTPTSASKPVSPQIAAATPSAPTAPARATATAPTASKEYVHIDLSSGRVVIELRPDLAPNHVQRVKLLVREGFYDGVTFHRVIAGFVAQTGDPTGTGKGSSKYPDLKAEFSQERFVRGTVGAARANDPNSANSQFFIAFAPTPHLDGKHTIWGQVVEGMELVDQIKQGDSVVAMRLAGPGGRSAGGAR